MIYVVNDLHSSQTHASFSFPTPIYFISAAAFHRICAGERLGKNPYACRDKARYHGFTSANIADGVAGSEGTGADCISSSYKDWTKEEDACLLAYVEDVGQSQWSAGTCFCANSVNLLFISSVSTLMVTRSSYACRKRYGLLMEGADQDPLVCYFLFLIRCIRFI